MAVIYLQHGLSFEVDEEREQILARRHRGAEPPLTMDFELLGGRTLSIRWGALVAVADSYKAVAIDPHPEGF